jgi:hypothetical protein
MGLIVAGAEEEVGDRSGRGICTTGSRLDLGGEITWLVSLLL